MNYTRVISEVAVRLERIGSFAQHVEHGRMDPAEALLLAEELLLNARKHLENKAA